MELPGVYDAADQASLKAQKVYLFLNAVRLCSLLIAAVTGGSIMFINEGSWPGWVTLGAFMAAFIAEIFLITCQPERDWYSGRAIAESAKTLSWRYAVGGQPFPKTMHEKQAESLLRERISEVLEKGKDRLDINSKPLVITEAMREYRSANFTKRRDDYLKLRTAAQRRWYSNKARSNSIKARHARLILLTGELVAIVLAVMVLFTETGIDFASVIAAIVATVAAWLAIKQYSQLASAYRVAAIELGLQEETLGAVTESGWAQAVADAEDAISREHTMWLASRGTA